MYTSRERVEDFLQISIDPSFTFRINEWIGAVKLFIDNYCGRTFEQEAATVKYYSGIGEKRLAIDDALSISKIEILDYDGNVNYTFDNANEFYLQPENASYKNIIIPNPDNAEITYWVKGINNIKVTGVFGNAATVPEDIRLVATKLIAGIIQEINTEIAGELTGENLGEYSASIQKVTEMANTIKIFDVLDQYKKYYV